MEINKGFICKSSVSKVIYYITFIEEDYLYINFNSEYNIDKGSYFRTKYAIFLTDIFK